MKAAWRKYFDLTLSWRDLYKLFCILLALVPIICIVRFIRSTGANNLSNDYVLYIDVVDRVLSGTYDWAHIFRDTFVREHQSFWVVLIHILTALVFDWNVYVEMYIGVFVAATRLVLLWLMFSPGLSVWKRWLLLPVLSVLIFSPSQISAFTFGTASLALQLSMLGAVLGIWGLLRFPNSWLGFLVMTLGGMLATWSWGAGLIAWPVFLITMIWLGFRRLKFFVAWFLTALAVCFPYIRFLVLENTTESMAVNNFSVIWNVFLNILGRPFANEIGLLYGDIWMSRMAGLLGIILGLAWMFYYGFKGRRQLSRCMPAWFVLLYSVLVVAQISLSRSMIAPWYTVPAMGYWTALMGLAFAGDNVTPGDEDRGNSGARGAGIFQFSLNSVLFLITLALVGGLYIQSNDKFDDKSLYLNSRSPASAACLRNFRTAPTYCEKTIYQWEPGHYHLVNKLAEPLERHGLSVFSPRQVWTLQGDFILDTVKVVEHAGVPGISWYDGLTSKLRSYLDYRHLNLLLYPPNSVTWTVSLPANVQNAVFRSAIAINPSVPAEAGADGLIFKLLLDQPEQNDIVLYKGELSPGQSSWQPFSVDLSKYAGQTIQVRMVSNMGKNSHGDWLMLRYPHIDLLVDKEKPAQQVERRFVPKLTEGDLVFDLNNPANWEATNASPESGNPESWNILPGARLEYRLPINARLSDYAYIYFRMAAPIDDRYLDRSQSRLLRIYYRLDSQVESKAENSISIPLLPDGETHAYSINLRDLGLDCNAILTGLVLEPLISIPGRDSETISIGDLRLVQNPDRQRCNP